MSCAEIPVDRDFIWCTRVGGKATEQLVVTALTKSGPWGCHGVAAGWH